MVTLLVPALDVKKYQINFLQFGVGEAVPETTVGIQGSMNMHRMRRSEELHRKAILHKGLAAA